MNKKKWALVLFAAILVFGYFKFFYKTYSETAVIKSADCIIALDIKRVTNTLIWQYITTPGQWKVGRLFPKKDDKVSWKDMFVLPDYVFAFHAKGQPANAWYIQLGIKNKGDFEKGLSQFQFEKINDHEYVSKVHGIHIFINDNSVLIANASVTDTAYLAAVADELFTQKNYVGKTILSKTIKAKCHLAVYIPANKFLQEDAVIAGNFNKEKIELNAAITPAPQYVFTEANFKFNSGYLSTAGFAQPTQVVYALLSSTYKEKISKALNVNIDSLMLPGNNTYSLNLAAFRQKADSAITYTYDDEFNKVEKVVVNNIAEPAFNFTITGDNVPSIYNYLLSSNKLEHTATGYLFTPMPLVKSYCTINNNLLAITSINYIEPEPDQTINAIFFFNLAIEKIPADIKKYLPYSLLKAKSNISAIKISAVKNKEQIMLSVIVNKMKNELPLIKL